MKAIATQTLIFLILIATFVILTIPSIINQIKPEVTTITTTTLKTKECSIDKDCELMRCPGGKDWSSCCMNENCRCCFLGTQTTTTIARTKHCSELGGYCCPNECAPGIKRLDGWCAQPGCSSCPEFVCCDGPCIGATTTTISGEQCMDSDGGINFSERGTTSGVNGTHTDYCTPEDNLVEYYCGGGYCSEAPCECLDPPECKNFRCPPCIPPIYTVSREVNCAGLCQDGACTSFCPEYNEKYKYTYISEDGMKVELEGKNKLSCSLILDQKQDEFDCRKDVYPGMEVVAQSYRSDWEICVELDITVTATNIYGDRGTCTYKCKVLI